MKTAIVHNDIFLKHETGFGHPESPERYRRVMEALRGNEELWGACEIVEAGEVSKGIIQAAHTKEHFRLVERAFANGYEALDGDTMISMRSFEAAVHATGAVCGAIDAVMEGSVDNAFAAVRPPGHHATAERAMGFCLFNNVAIAARYAINKYKDIERVAIVDWDVHHGNGTQGIFYDDPDVHFFSMHQYPWYPGTGSRGETGFGRGRGFTLNVPVKAATPAREQRRVFDTAISEISVGFRPDLIIISAGFDAHESDPLGLLLLEDEDYREMTKVVKEWAAEACEGRVVSSLEGGYNLETLGGTVVSHVSAMLNDQ